MNTNENTIIDDISKLYEKYPSFDRYGDLNTLKEIILHKCPEINQLSNMEQDFRFKEFFLKSNEELKTNFNLNLPKDIINSIRARIICQDIIIPFNQNKLFIELHKSSIKIPCLSADLTLVLSISFLENKSSSRNTSYIEKILINKNNISSVEYEKDDYICIFMNNGNTYQISTTWSGDENIITKYVSLNDMLNLHNVKIYENISEYLLKKDSV